MAELYLKQRGTQIEAKVWMNSKLVLKERFKRSEAIAKIEEYLEKYSISYVEHSIKDQGIGGAGTWTTYWYRKEIEIIEFVENLEWIFRDKRKAN